MSTNRISKDADELLFTVKEAKHLTEAKYVLKSDLLALGAIYEKYKRYEETLKTISDCPDHKDGLCEICRKIIEMELKFDPLSTSSPSGQ